MMSHVSRWRAFVGVLLVAVGASWPNPSAAQPLPHGQLAVDNLGIGDANADIVFTPLTPCRLIDTRVAGGAFASGQTRTYNLVGPMSYASIGGNALGCGIPATTSPSGNGTVGNTVRALVLNFAPTMYAVANGVDVVTCTEAVPVGNLPCPDDLSLQVIGGPVHVVVDVLGYYAPQSHVLAKNRTLKGVFSVEFVAVNALDQHTTALAFHPRLTDLAVPFLPGQLAAEIVFAGFPSTPNCPGSFSDPRANPGFVCFYESFNVNVDQWCVTGQIGTWRCYSVDQKLDPIGVGFKITALLPGRSASMGVWAVTPPN